LFYSVVLTFWGIVASGGGHFNLPVMLAVAPLGAGFFFWPVWAFLSVNFSSLLSRCLFLCLIVAHYLGLIFHVLNPDNSDMHWFWIAMSAKSFIFYLALSVGLYLVGQIYLWSRFLRDGFGLRSGCKLAKESQ
jgi:hypothetical protein